MQNAGLHNNGVHTSLPTERISQLGWTDYQQLDLRVSKLGREYLGDTPSLRKTFGHGSKVSARVGVVVERRGEVKTAIQPR
ncbi:unnamed protein product [Protopolystoma xenopodis]|uniref:Uncharacterized protein n=1 Tax=Protopolystoma xenopodis TaxID=117903 RepID=A0A3S5CP21_9PLAT|nr:unnamed protein product [Protopolystoma xenopodis]